MASDGDADYCPDSSVSPLSDHSSSVNDQGTEPPPNVADTTPQEDNNAARSENTENIPQNGLGGISMADIQKGLDFLTAPHHGWDPSGQAMAKCDLCGQAGHRVVYKCSECKLTICKGCCEAGKLNKDRRHHLEPESVSWEPPPRAKRARARGGNQASGGRRGLRARGGSVKGRSHTFGRLRSQSPPEATSTIVVDSSLINTSPDHAVTEHEENQGLARRDTEQLHHGDPPNQPRPPMKRDQSLQYHHATPQRLPEGASRLAHPHASSQHQPGVLRPLEPRPTGDHGQVFPQPRLHSNNANSPLMFPPRPAVRDDSMRQGAHNHRFAPYPLPQDRRRVNAAYHNANMGPPQVPLYSHPPAGAYGVPHGFAPPTPVQPTLMPHNYPRPGSDSLQVNHYQVRYPSQGPTINTGGSSMGNQGTAPTPYPHHRHHHRHHHHHYHRHKRPTSTTPCSPAQEQDRLPSVRSLLTKPGPLPHTRASTPQHGAPPHRPSPDTRPDVVFPPRPQNRGLLQSTPALAPSLHAPGPSPAGASATPPAAPPPGTPVAPLGRPPHGAPGTPPVPPADEWAPQSNVEALGHRLIQASTSMRNAYPNVALDHCLRHEMDFLWTYCVLPAADVEASFRVLLGATYYAATYFRLDPRQNVAREWLGEKEQALIELGYEPIRSMPSKSFLGWERK